MYSHDRLMYIVLFTIVSSSTVSYDIEQEEENSLVIATDEELTGEDDEVTGVFSGAINLCCYHNTISYNRTAFTRRTDC